MKHPIQPLETDQSGVTRFKSNPIVEHLLNWATERGMGLNELACMEFTEDDRQQFAQLIGYSLAGYSELPYVDNEAYGTVEKMATGMSEDKARIEWLEMTLEAVRATLRPLCATLFRVHEDDL